MGSDPTSVDVHVPSVRVWRAEGGLAVQPPCLDVLNPILTVRRLTAGPAAGGPAVGRADEALYRVVSADHDPWLVCPVGLRPAVVAALQRAGRTVGVETGYCAPADPGRVALLRRQGYLFDGDAFPFDELPPPAVGRAHAQPGLLDHVRRRDRSLIVHGPGVDPVVLVGQVAAAWPALPVAVLVGTRAAVGHVAHRLRALGVDAVGVREGQLPAGSAQLAVSTYAHAASGPTEPAWVRLVFCLDAMEAIGRARACTMEYYTRAHVFGFLATQDRPSPYEWAKLRSLFGFEEFVVPRPHRRNRPAAVAWRRFGGDGGAADGDHVLAVKRRQVWHHRRRNRLVARLAEEAAQAPTVPELRDRLGRSLRTLVLVENAEHAGALAEHLRDWPVVVSPTANLAGMGCRWTPLPASAGWPRTMPDWAIATAAGLARLDLDHFDVLVRADAGVGLPPDADRFLDMADAGELTLPLFVIDLDDRHHSQLHQHARRRRAAYERAGWLPAGVRAADARVEQFLSRRGSGR